MTRKSAVEAWREVDPALRQGVIIYLGEDHGAWEAHKRLCAQTNDDYLEPRDLWTLAAHVLREAAGPAPKRRAKRAK